MSATALKGFNSFNDVDLLNQVQQSVISYFDWGFLDKGAFTNISLGQTDINSNDQSKLRKVYDSSYSDGQVWETFHHNLVWESGLTNATQPTKISGVYIDGTFRKATDTGYEHYIDYERGRVVFDSVQNATTIKMEYSYKTICFDAISIYPEVSTLQLDTYNFTNYNSFQSGNYVSLLRKQLPLVAVEVTPRLVYRPEALGTGAQWANTDILMHIVDSDNNMVYKLLSYISLQKEQTIYGLNINMMISSGVFPLDYRGALISNPKTYPQLINGGYQDDLIYFNNAISTMNGLVGGNLYYGVVRFTTETIAAV